MIWIIGGTSEARTLIKKLEGKKEFIVSVATYSGAEMLDYDKVIISRMNQQEMGCFIIERNIDMVIDMSHPYAAEVSKNARAACSSIGIRYLRFIRKGMYIKDSVNVASVEACVDYLQNINGNVFFTTGIKNIKDFEKARRHNRFIYRVLPSSFSIQACIDNNIKMQDIIAILGPVSEDMNYQMFKDFDANFVVMKDSGIEGGTENKVRACKRLGITPIIIGREIEDYGTEDMDKLLEMIL